MLPDLKRASDIAGSVVLLALAAPLLAAIAALVRLSSGSPVLFSQERVGKDFRPFRLWKFRTMRNGAGGPLVTAAGDARITRFGRVLRAWKLDELPQLWNVLAGDMSLVGPRPEVPRYVELYRDRFERILTVRPGITDIASIRFRDEEALLAGVPDPERRYREHVLPRKLALSEQYAANSTFFSDLRILFLTLVAVARRG